MGVDPMSREDRQSARDVLKWKIGQVEKRLKALQRVESGLDWDSMNAEEEQHLWELMMELDGRL